MSYPVKWEDEYEIQFNLVYLIPFLPLIGFLINGLGRNVLSKSLVSIIGSGVILVLLS